MAAHPLDNPFFSALSTLHRQFALGEGGVLRYPADVAPFVGLADAQVPVAQALTALVVEDDTALLLGIAPGTVPAGWALQPLDTLVQMTCEQTLAVPYGPDIVELGQAQRADLLALTALVYPHYFRARTMELGRYFGMYVDGRLAAIIGERLGAPGWREMSAICTHPDFLGRGYARRLTAFLGNDTLRRGDVPFLHVSPANARALGLYEAIGYRQRRRIPFWSLRRAGA
jgi:ribosomal protein S18 acetylase RimI-like enzyme